MIYEKLCIICGNKFISKRCHAKSCSVKCKVKAYNNSHPWALTHRNITYRCTNPNDKKYKYYGGKGIKCLLSLKEVKVMWIRDEASLMKQPSIDRINSSGNYEFKNCQFIEMEDNRRNNHFSLDNINNIIYTKDMKNKKITTIPTVKCQKCGFEWITRKENPRKCPYCLSYDWNGKLITREKNDENTNKD